MTQEQRDTIIARLLHQNGAYWIFHKAFADDQIDQVLEKKPEEKIWRVVRDNKCPEMEMPCYRLKKKDLIKVGRVRFKIRDIMSPVYREIENGVEDRYETHREVFPSMLGQSISSSIIHQESGSEEDPDDDDDQDDDNEEEGGIADAHQNALLTESDQEDQEPGDLLHANTILQNDLRAGLDGVNVEEDLGGSDREDPNNT